MKKLKARGLHEQVIDDIGRRILSGEFVPGVPLLNESTLCGRSGVSRTALREALWVLASKSCSNPSARSARCIAQATYAMGISADSALRGYQALHGEHASQADKSCDQIFWWEADRRAFQESHIGSTCLSILNSDVSTNI